MFILRVWSDDTGPAYHVSHLMADHVATIEETLGRVESSADEPEVLADLVDVACSKIARWVEAGRRDAWNGDDAPPDEFPLPTLEINYVNTRGYKFELFNTDWKK